MRKQILKGGFLFLVFASSACFLAAGDDRKSGPQPGESIPGSFHPFNINGKYGKGMLTGDVVDGRHHCLVCEYALRPVALVFARLPKDDKLLTELLKKLDEAVANDPNNNLRSFVVFLSPYGTDSVIEASLPEEKKTKDPGKLIDIAINRKVLLQKLEEFAKPLKNVIVAYYMDEGPKGYKISPKSEFTILLYENYKVQKNYFFEPGQMTDFDLGEVMKGVDVLSGKTKKKAETPEK